MTSKYWPSIIFVTLLIVICDKGNFFYYHKWIKNNSNTFFITVSCENVERRLLEDIKLNDYDVRFRPVKKHNEAVNITIGVDIVRILSIV